MLLGSSQPVIDMGYMSLPPAVQQEMEDLASTENQKHKNCTVCSTRIEMMCRYYDDVCCIICEKVKMGEMDRIKARAFKPDIPLEDGQWRPSM